MKKAVVILVTALVLFLSAWTALAVEIPDPDFYFNVDGRRYDSSDSIMYRYTFENNAQAAAMAYVGILRDNYNMSVVSSYDDGEGMWVLEAMDGTEVEVIYAPGDNDTVYVTVYSSTVDLMAAQSWDWNMNAVAEKQVSDATILPDFLQNDSTATYVYLSGGTDGGQIDIDFQADNTCDETLHVVADYVELLMNRGYKLIDKTEKEFEDSITETWFLECSDNELNTMDKSNAYAHVRVKINAYYDWGICDVEVCFVDGISMEGYRNGRIADENDDDNIFENDCSWCGGDGECDDCGGSGYVRNWVPGTREYIRQRCEDCNMGQCKRCGGRGKSPD